MKQAYKIKDLTNFSGRAALYKLSEPMGDHGTDEVFSYVVVSATIPMWGGGPETYIFPANEEGKVTSWGELEGSFRGALSHEMALNNAGYELVQGALPEAT